MVIWERVMFICVIRHKISTFFVFEFYYTWMHFEWKVRLVKLRLSVQIDIWSRVGFAIRFLDFNFCKFPFFLVCIKWVQDIQFQNAQPNNFGIIEKAPQITATSIWTFCVRCNQRWFFKIFLNEFKDTKNVSILFGWRLGDLGVTGWGSGHMSVHSSTISTLQKW